MPAIPHIVAPSKGYGRPLPPATATRTVPLKEARAMPIPCICGLIQDRPRDLEMEQRKAIENDVRRFITENFPLGGSGFELKGSDSFLEVGVIDSVGVLELIEHIEATYELQIPDA